MHCYLLLFTWKWNLDTIPLPHVLRANVQKCRTKLRVSTVEKSLTFIIGLPVGATPKQENEKQHSFNVENKRYNGGRISQMALRVPSPQYLNTVLVNALACRGALETMSSHGYLRQTISSHGSGMRLKIRDKPYISIFFIVLILIPAMLVINCVVTLQG